MRCDLELVFVYAQFGVAPMTPTCQEDMLFPGDSIACPGLLILELGFCSFSGTPTWVLSVKECLDWKFGV